MTAPRACPHRVRSYIRVSSDKQATRGTSLEGQRDAHLAYCVAHHLPEPVFYIEVESASDLAIEKRDEQLRIQREAERGEMILVTVLDRWSRDVPHAVSTVRTLIKRGVGVVLFQDGIDASTPEGDWMLVQRAAMAEQERKRLIERTVVRRKQLADAGLYVYGAQPLGYKANRRRLVIVPGEDDVVRDIFERCATGETLAEIAAALPPIRKRTRWTVHAVFRVLRNRCALGEVQRSDGTWIAAHDAIVSRDLWERAHAALRERAHGGRRFATGESARRLLRGMAKCAACEKRVSVRFGSPRSRQGPEVDGTRIHYYVCRGVLAGECGEGWIRAYAIDAAAGEEIVERLTELRDELARPAPAPVRPARRDVAGMLARIETQRGNAVDLATGGAMSRDDLLRALARYEEQAAALRREAERAAEEDARRAAATDPVVRQKALREVRALRLAWSRMAIEQRREALAILAARVEVGRAGVRIQWRPAADLTGEWGGARRVT